MKNTESLITEKPVTLEKKQSSYAELLAEAKASPDVIVQEIKPCQSVTVETKDKPAFLVVMQ